MLCNRGFGRSGPDAVRWHRRLTPMARIGCH